MKPRAKQIGDKWSYTLDIIKPPQKVEGKVIRECKIKDRQRICVKLDKTSSRYKRYYELCIEPDLALPLYAKMVNIDKVSKKPDNKVIYDYLELNKTIQQKEV